MSRAARLSWHLRVLALMSGVALGCSDSNDRSTAPQACSPGERRCDDVPGKIAICSKQGTWEYQSCASGASCNPQSLTCSSSCTPGSSKCSASRRLICADDGHTWAPSSCPEGQACDLQDGSAVCAKQICTPAKLACVNSPAVQMKQCSASGTAWVDAPSCSSGQACVTRDGEGRCENKVCVPGVMACSADFATLQTCNPSGTALLPQPGCAANEYCINGGCKPAEQSLGSVVIATSGTVSLSPGHYAVAVVDTDPTTDAMTSFPLTISGAVSATTLPSIDSASVHSKPLLRCGVSRKSSFPAKTIVAPHPSPVFPTPTSPHYAIGDTRTFHVIASGEQKKSRTARLRAIGAIANFWEDQTTAPSGAQVPDAALSELVKRIDEGVAQRNKTILGAFSDVDGNGKVDILFTDLLPSDGASAYVSPVTLFHHDDPDTDHGEIVYSQGTLDVSAAELAGMLAHEMGHLISFGRRFKNYLSSGWDSMPSELFSTVFVEEGIANLAMSNSGQSNDWPFIFLIGAPGQIAIERLLHSDYHDHNDTANAAGYGMGSMALRYLFDQAGGVEITGPSEVKDNGGIAYVSALMERSGTESRVAPLDNRSTADWFTDMGTALLLTTIQGKVSAATHAERRWHFNPAKADPYFGGLVGAPLYESGQSIDQRGMVSLTSWAKRPAQMRRGGMNFFDLTIGAGGAKATISSSTTRLVVVRHQD